MIYVTGDIHAKIEDFIEDCERRDLTEDDYVIICGDFGGVWFTDDPTNDNFYYKESYAYFWYEEKKLNLLASKPWTTLFVDGNHENHTRLSAMPVVQWNGGCAHMIRHNIIHLMRGQIFTIEGKTFFTMGGAESHDIKDGILDPYTQADVIEDWATDPFKLFRIDGISWWKGEVPDYMERSQAYMNLLSHKFEVDYIITHELPSSFVAFVSHGYYKPTEYSKWLEELRPQVKYKKWFGGHYHRDLVLNEKDVVLYNDFIPLR